MLLDGRPRPRPCCSSHASANRRISNSNSSPFRCLTRAEQTILAARLSSCFLTAGESGFSGKTYPRASITVHLSSSSAALDFSHSRISASWSSASRLSMTLGPLHRQNFCLAALDQCRDMFGPYVQGFALFLGVCCAVINAGNASLVARHMVEYRLHDVRLHTNLGHASGSGAPQVVQRPMLEWLAGLGDAGVELKLGGVPPSKPGVVTA